MAEDILEKTRTAAENAIKWVAAEFYYAKEMKKDLEDAKAHLENGKSDVKKAIQAMNYIGRAESRATRAESQLEADIESLKKAVPVEMRAELDNVGKDIDIASKNLVKNISRYEGKMRGELNLLQVQIALLEKGKGSEAVVKELISQIIDEVNEILRWLSAMQTDLRNAKVLEEKIEKWAKG